MLLKPLELTIYIVAEPWKSPEFDPRSRRFYRRKTTSEFQAALREAWRLKYSGRAPIRGPVRLEALFIMPRPKYMMWKKKPMPRVPHTKVPDVDNLMKNLKDALKQVAMADDALIYDEHARKFIAAGDESPHITIKIWED